ncbi:MAG TPA: DUF1643 domain-containing protein [Wenzhouxiangella sp.]
MQTPFPFYPDMKREATFSSCQRYRYSLLREWSATQSKVLFVGLNPSTADAELDDPTIRRCIGFAKAWGFGGLYMGNLFAYRSTDPKGLLATSDPIGPDNDAVLLQLAQAASLVVAAWGNHGTLMDRAEQVKSLCRPLSILKLNRSGQPAHPLYLKGDLRPMPWME